MFHVVIADRKQLRVLEETTAQGPLRELAVLLNPDVSTHERDLVADRGGRTASSASGARQEYGPRVSARDVARDRWLKLATRQVATLLSARRSDGCVLVAAPRLLPALRVALPARAPRIACVEITRDLAKTPAETLRRRLQPGLAALRRGRARQGPGAHAARRGAS